MRRRKWTNKEKSRIVLSGLKGQSVSILCSEYGICQSQYYQWRDQFLSNAEKTFDSSNQSKREERLQRENQRLKGAIGDLTLELKKSEEWL